LHDPLALFDDSDDLFWRDLTWGSAVEALVIFFSLIVS